VEEMVADIGHGEKKKKKVCRGEREASGGSWWLAGGCAIYLWWS